MLISKSIPILLFFNDAVICEIDRNKNDDELEFDGVSFECI